jgi:phytoene dehydrogenase-like protein
MSKHIIVIGAGIAGLSAASYLLRNGYQVTVLEKHTEPGGLCTSWKRKGYTIDYCIHWMMGTREGTDFYPLWQELGAFTNADGSSVPIVNFDTFTTMELSTGESVCLSSNLEEVRDTFFALAPEDEKEILKFYKTLKTMAGTTSTNPLVKRISGFRQLMALMSHLLPMQEYAKRFKSPKLRELFLTEIPSDWSLVSLSMGLSQQPLKSAGYPVGGSLNIAKNIARLIEEKGGVIRYKSDVQKIVVSEGKATGVTLSDGTTLSSDYVISAADGYSTLYSMLDGAYVSKPYKKAFAEYPLFPSSLMVAFGIHKDLSSFTHASSLYLKEPIVFPNGTSQDRLNLNIYHYDPTLAPKGCTLVTALFNTWETEAWVTLAKEHPAKYKAEKKRIADEVLQRLEQVFGSLEGLVDMVDVSTPYSVVRYTSNWKGSFEGFAPTKATLSTRLPKKLAGLANFAMIGQWTTPGGGLPTAAKDGHDIAKMLCKEDGKPFSTEWLVQR